MSTGTDLRVREAQAVFAAKWHIDPKTLYISENLYRYLLADLFATTRVNRKLPVTCFGMNVVVVKRDDYIGIAP